MSKNPATARIDSVIESEVSRGYRIRELPDAIRVAIQRELGREAPHYIRLSSINPRRRELIAEVVQEQYHDDLLNPRVRSDAQILEAAEKKGEWSLEKKRKMEELQDAVFGEMAKLYHEGFDPNDNPMQAKLAEHTLVFLGLVDGAGFAPELLASVKDVFERWLGFTPDQAPAYTSLYAEKQQRERYLPEVDFSFLLDHLPMAAIDELHAIEELKDRQERLVTLNERSLELAELQGKHARIFAGSAESRQLATEEMATLYFTSEVVDAEGTPKGKLAPAFDGLKDFPLVAIRWLTNESQFFHNHVPDIARKVYEQWGFHLAERKQASVGENAPSAESLAPDSSSSDSAPAAVVEKSSAPSPAAS